MELQRPARFVATIVALAAALAVFSIAALRLQPASHVSLVYPATGLGAALLWGFGVRLWPAVVIAQFAISLSVGNRPAIATFVASTELKRKQFQRGIRQLYRIACNNFVCFFPYQRHTIACCFQIDLEYWTHRKFTYTNKIVKLWPNLALEIVNICCARRYPYSSIMENIKWAKLFS